MDTLKELIHYCNDPDPIGALMLVGEWGSGKTYLLENDLPKALKDTHIFVRISLFGMTDANTLRDTVRRRWFEVCTPLIGALSKVRDNGFWTQFNMALQALNPTAGAAAHLVAAIDLQNLVPILPEIDDFETLKKKRVVLIYDDMERVSMESTQLLGVINEYCENQHFNSIISVNEEAFEAMTAAGDTTYHMLREKTISAYIRHVPDYAAIINTIIYDSVWPSQEYGAYLCEHEDVIRDVFMPPADDPKHSYLTGSNRKYHNFRTLAKGLRSFQRIYAHIKRSGKEVPDACLYSFLAYYIAAKSGICIDGKPKVNLSDDEIRQYYPRFSSDAITEVERAWIADGIWDKKK